VFDVTKPGAMPMLRDFLNAESKGQKNA